MCGKLSEILKNVQYNDASQANYDKDHCNFNVNLVWIYPKHCACVVSAIRSGDYYLFEDESEAHTDPEDPTSITLGVESSEEEDEGKADPLKVGGYI